MQAASAGATLVVNAGSTSLKPDMPHVAVFDTAFHATIPDEAAATPCHGAGARSGGIRRYGFHGLSVAWAASACPSRDSSSATWGEAAR